jgi:hypothetical protein
MDGLFEEHAMALEARDERYMYLAQIRALEEKIARLEKELEDARKINAALQPQQNKVVESAAPLKETNPFVSVPTLPRCRHDMVPSEGLKIHGRGMLECSKCRYTRYVGPN